MFQGGERDSKSCWLGSIPRGSANTLVLNVQMLCSTEGGASLIAVWPFSVLHSITLIDKIAHGK